MTVRIVTDSTCDLPPDLVAAHGITVVPLTVIFGEEAFEDGVTITPADFYQRLRSSSLLPRTSQLTRVASLAEALERVELSGLPVRAVPHHDALQQPQRGEQADQ